MFIEAAVRHAEAEDDMLLDVELISAPTIKDYLFLCGLSYEVGIFRRNGMWWYRKGECGGVAGRDLPPSADIVTHTHGIVELPDSLDVFPSSWDFIHSGNHPERSKFFVVSSQGIVRFWPLDLHELSSLGRIHEAGELYDLRSHHQNMDDRQYKAKLLQLGCKWSELHTWQDIRDDLGLHKLLTG